MSADSLRSVWPACLLLLPLTVTAGQQAPRTNHPGQPPAPATMAEALDRYGAGDFEALAGPLKAARDVKEGLARFPRDAEQWIMAGAEPDRAWRLAVAATATVDLLGRTIEREFDPHGQVGRALAEWMCALLRRASPSDFERVFHLATMSILQAADDEELLVGVRYTGRLVDPQQHVLHGASRFPDESRFKLAWLMRYELVFIASEPITPGYLINNLLGRFEHDGGAVRNLNDTIAALTKLADDPGVGEEARLRRGVLRFLMDEPAAAATDLQPLTASSDPFIRYNAHMILGAIRTRAGDLPAAEGHYRAAFTTVRATSAGTMLATSLFRLGRAAEAAEVLAQSEGLPPEADPWRQYGMRDYRLFPGYLAQMRAMVVR